MAALYEDTKILSSRKEDPLKRAQVYECVGEAGGVDKVNQEETSLQKMEEEIWPTQPGLSVGPRATKDIEYAGRKLDDWIQKDGEKLYTQEQEIVGSSGTNYRK